MAPTRKVLVPAAFGLALLAWLIYFRNAFHFFQGDTIYWFYHRLTSLGEFVRSFANTDPGGWYRPLTNRTVQWLFYPSFGLEPAPYRVFLFILFFADIVAVIALAMTLTARPLAAVLAGTFFTIHTVNAYTTYDLSFVPELLYTFFYICAAIAFLQFLKTRKPIVLVVSLLCFGLSLCSKESAVTLPLTAIVLALLAGHRIKDVARSVIPHALLLSLYLIFTLGYLGVASEALASLHHPPTQLDTGGYYFMVGPHMLTNAGTAWSWALNLPVGMLGQWRDSTRMRNLVLWSFATAQMLLIFYGLWRGDRREVISGMAWFWIAALPAFPLMGHFLPYYMFLPITGFAVMVGITWSRLFEEVGKTAPIGATVLLVAVFGVLTLVCARTAQSEARNNFLLGASSRIAQTSLDDLRALYPSIPPGTVFYIDDAGHPDLSFNQGQGGLFKLAYHDPSLRFQYASFNEPPQKDAVHLVYRDGHLRKGE